MERSVGGWGWGGKFDLKIEEYFLEKGARTWSGGREGASQTFGIVSAGPGPSPGGRGHDKCGWTVHGKQAGGRQSWEGERGYNVTIYRSHWDERGSSDLAHVNFRITGASITVMPGSVQGMNSQDF